MHYSRHSLRINSTQSPQDLEIGGLSVTAHDELSVPLPSVDLPLSLFLDN